MKTLKKQDIDVSFTCTWRLVLQMITAGLFGKETVITVRDATITLRDSTVEENDL